LAKFMDLCVNVLRGTLDLDQSRKNGPIYRSLCRHKNGKSYNETVNGTTFKTLTQDFQ